MKSRLALLVSLAMFFVQGHTLGQSDTWTDPATKLMWATQDNGADVDWNQAGNYCSNLRLGGYANWRLATIDELAGIYDETQDVNGHHIKGGIKLSGWPWSSSPGNTSGDAWVFFFTTGERLSDHLAYNALKRALCVRRSGK